MIETEIKKELTEYLEYIKEVYLITFDKVLNDDTKQKIKNIDSNILEVDLESEFRIKIGKKIRFCLNIDKFIKENNFENENFNDIDEDSLKKINYYLDYRNDILKLAKDHLLENVILYFIDNLNKDVITLGTASLISEHISKKYNLSTTNECPKERELIEYFIKIIGEKKWYTMVLNHELELLKVEYNQYIINTNYHDFNSLVKKMDKIYNNYGNNKGRVYYVDCLYYYQKINYEELIQELNKVIELKKKKIDIIYSRLESIIDCMKELERYKIIYNNEEKMDVYYANLNLKRIINKINEEQNVEKYCNELMEMEQKLKPIVNKIWKYYLADPIDYKNDEQHWMLVETLTKGYFKNENRFVITNLITTGHIKLPSEDNRYQYGFVYQIKENSIIYASSDKIVYREFEKPKDYEVNQNTVIHDTKVLEIEEQKDSILMTPRNLLIKTVQTKQKCNQVLIDKNDAYVVGVFCITDGSEDNISYKKAKDLSDKFELPLIPILKNE